MSLAHYLQMQMSLVYVALTLDYHNKRPDSFRDFFERNYRLWRFSENYEPSRVFLCLHLHRQKQWWLYQSHFYMCYRI